MSNNFSDFKIAVDMINKMMFYKLHFVFGIICAAGFSIIQIFRPLVLKFIIDDFLNIPEKEFSSLKIYLTIYFFLLMFSIVFSYFQVYFLSGLGVRVLNNLKIDLFKKLILQEMNFYTKHQSGEITARIESDVEQIKGLFSAHSITFIVTIVIIIGTFITLYVHVPVMSYVIIVFTAIICSIYYFVLKKIRLLFYKSREEYKQLSSFLSEYIKGISCLQTYNAESSVLDQLIEINNRKYKIEKKLSVVNYLSISVFRSFSGPLLFSLIFFFLHYKIGTIGLTIGTVIMIFEYCRNIFMPLQHLAEEISQLQGSFVSLKRVYQIMEIETEKNTGNISEIDGVFEFVFDNVWFAYEPDKWVLKNVSFKVSSGRKIAVIGPSGSGKTTISKLLMRFYKPQRGEIFLNGINIKNYDLNFIRNFISLVIQNVTFFPGTLYENLTVLKTRITKSDVQKIISKIGLKNFVEKLPDGLDYKIIEGGKNFSMGQRQLLSFARAFLRNSQLLILDEATAFVDTTTEFEIQRIIDKLFAKKSLMVIAHRLSTIKKCDEILVLKEGVIFEKGTHNELIHKKGEYFKMLRCQEIK
jgi:ATP-binding cassette subfamily B protein